MRERARRWTVDYGTHVDICSIPLSQLVCHETGDRGEQAVRDVVMVHGLPDLVFPGARNERSSGGRNREAADAVVLGADASLIIQVKTRTSIRHEERERSWLKKEIETGLSQAQGSEKEMRSADADLTWVDGRGRSTCIDSDRTWIHVVVVNHPLELDSPFDLTDLQPPGSIVLQIEDWEFLFAHLGSSGAVIRYLEEVSQMPPITLGGESRRYLDIAAQYERRYLDERGRLDVSGRSSTKTYNPYPVTIPGEQDLRLLRMGRSLVEAFAEGQDPVDCIDPVESRLRVLTALDRLPPLAWIDVGVFLQDAISLVVKRTYDDPEVLHWRIRGLVDGLGGTAQCIFAVASETSDDVRTRFRWYMELFHHDKYGDAHDVDAPPTVGLLLSLASGARVPLQLSSFSVAGDLQMSDHEAALRRDLWDTRVG